MKKFITVQTRLNDGIYKSHGGGEVRTHYRLTVGPRNLLKAIEFLRVHRAQMRDGFGDVGCGSSWLEIDGQKIRHFAIQQVIEQQPFDDAGYTLAKSERKTRTMRAIDLINEVLDKRYNVNTISQPENQS